MAIKPKYVKQLGRILLEKYPGSFNKNFETNKESVTALTNVESKEVRNRIAGYITRKEAGAAAKAAEA
jgi:small subunit ribosomal protein S17e